MNRRLVVRIVTALLAVAMLAVPASALAGKNGGGKKKDKALVVCKHGCKYRTIQKAVNKAGKTKKKDDVIKVKPGKYVEGVQVLGKKYKGLTIMGTNKNARKTILEGKNAQLPGGVGIANNGIEIADAKDVDDQEHVGPQLRDQRRLLARHQHRRQQGDLPERRRQERRRLLQPQLRPLHVRLRGRQLQQVGGLGPRRLRLLRRRDAVPGRTRRRRS